MSISESSTAFWRNILREFHVNFLNDPRFAMTYTDTGAQSEGTPRNDSAFSSTGLCYIWCRHIVDWYTHHVAPANRQSSLTRDRTSVPVAEYPMSQPIIPCTITEHYAVTTRSEITLYFEISTVANERIWSELNSQNAPHNSPVCALHYWNNLPCYKGIPWMERYLSQLPAIWDTMMLLGRHSNIRCDQKISKSPIINTVYLLLDLQYMLLNGGGYFHIFIKTTSRNPGLYGCFCCRLQYVIRKLHLSRSTFS